MPPKTNKIRPRVLKLADFDHRRLLLEEFAEKRRLKQGSHVLPGASSRSLPGVSNVVLLADRASSFASIEIDELSALTPVAQRISVMALLRDHLAMEFGQYRITQSNRSFIIQHRSLDELISALLRVQYHLHQCTAEDLAAVNVPASFVTMNLTWGVGPSPSTADAERVKQRRRKRFSSDQ